MSIARQPKRIQSLIHEKLGAKQGLITNKDAYLNSHRVAFLTKKKTLSIMESVFNFHEHLSS